MISPPDMMPILVGIQSIRVDSVPNRGISEGFDGEWDSIVELLQELFKDYLQYTCLFPNHIYSLKFSESY